MPHPSVSGLVQTVCACANFPRKTWEFGYHRLLTVYFHSYAIENVRLCESSDTKMSFEQVLQYTISRVGRPDTTLKAEQTRADSVFFASTRIRGLYILKARER